MVTTSRSLSFRLALLVCVAGVSVGCQSTPPPNRGTSGTRIDPTSDSQSELGNQTLRSADLVTATDRMAQSIAARPDINNPKSPPRIFVGQIENMTSGRQLNYQVFLARLRAQLQESGSRHGLQFIRERDFVEMQRDREYGGKDPQATAEAYTSRSDYVLTCEIYDLPSGGTNYYLLDYQLVQLRDAASGPDVGSGAIVWEGKYEVKYQ